MDELKTYYKRIHFKSYEELARMEDYLNSGGVDILHCIIEDRHGEKIAHYYIRTFYQIDGWKEVKE